MDDWNRGNQDGDRKQVDELNDKGIEEYNKGNFDKAEEYYKWAIEKDPEYKWAYYNLGLLYKALERNDLAVEYYHKALKIDDAYADAYNGLGAVYFQMDQLDEAEKYYRKAIEFDPDLQYPYYNLGLIMDKRQDIEQAKTFYQQAIEKNPSYAKAHNSLGICYYNDKDYEQAMQHYELSIKANPDSVYPYYNIALIYEKKMDWKNARRWYKKALEIDPHYKYASDGLEYAEKQLGDDLDDKDDAENIEEVKEEKHKGLLERFGRNLNEVAKEGKIFEPVGRDQEIQNILEILYKRIKNNPILVGHPGVGKTAIAEGLAKRIVEKKVPQYFLDKEIVELNIGTLVAGTTYRGQLEEKIRQVIEEVKKRKNVIIFLDEIHTLIGAGKTEGGTLDVAQMLKPVLARGEFPCVGATTHTEYQKYFEKDPALERRFYPVRVDELDPEQTVQVLNYLKPKLEKHYKISISEENIKMIVELTEQHIKKRYFPDKAIDIFEKTASRVSLAGREEITPKDVMDMVSESSGVRILENSVDEATRLMDMEEALKSKIMGQDDAIERVASLVRMTKRRLDLKPERPDGVFLFVGPSGVGKTELAKQLCLFLYGNEKKLIKLDMTEFSESHSVSKLIGSPPGYVGYSDQAYLASKIEEHPSSVLILDEVEKAHPDVIKLFLQVFDEGNMKDARGKTVIFSDVTIIMTSNIIREWKTEKTLGFAAAAPAGEDKENQPPATQEIVEKLSGFFPLEFLNRIDEIILFHALSKENLKEIVNKKIIKKAKEIFLKQDIELSFKNAVIDEVISSGYSKEFGARNLERTFETLILRPLSNLIFAQKVTAGAKLKVDFKDNEVVIK